MDYPTQNEEMRYIQSLTSICYIFAGFGILFSIGAGAAHKSSPIIGGRNSELLKKSLLMECGLLFM